MMAVTAFITRMSMMMAFPMAMPTLMTFAMMMLMVTTPGVRVIRQSSFNKSFCSRIRRPLNPRIKPDT